MRKIFATILAVVIIIGAAIYTLSGVTGNVTAGGNRHAIIQTDKGEINILLHEDKAPITTANFIKLAERGFYDGLTFHRVIKDFVVQGGDPSGDGTGGPGYFIKDEFHKDLTNVRGAVAMANAGPNTGGSQFFILTTDAPWLDGKHPVFGTVVRGYDVVLKIQQGDVMRSVKIV